MSYLLDTNVLGELRKPHMHPNVRAWYTSVTDDDLYLSVLVIGEVRRGIEGLRSRDARQAAVFETWLHRVRRDFEDRVVPISDAVAQEWGRQAAQGPLPVVDGLLAATALVHGWTLVTRNVRDVGRTGVRLLDPFATEPSTK